MLVMELRKHESGDWEGGLIVVGPVEGEGWGGMDQVSLVGLALERLGRGEREEGEEMLRSVLISSTRRVSAFAFRFSLDLSPSPNKKLTTAVSYSLSTFLRCTLFFFSFMKIPQATSKQPPRSTPSPPTSSRPPSSLLLHPLPNHPRPFPRRNTSHLSF